MASNVFTFCCIAYFICLYFSFSLFKEQRTAQKLGALIGWNMDDILILAGTKYLLIGKFTMVIGFGILGYFLLNGLYGVTALLFGIGVFVNIVLPIDYIAICNKFLANLSNNISNEAIELSLKIRLQIEK